MHLLFCSDVLIIPSTLSFPHHQHLSWWVFSSLSLWAPSLSHAYTIPSSAHLSLATSTSAFPLIQGSGRLKSHQYTHTAESVAGLPLIKALLSKRERRVEETYMKLNYLRMFYKTYPPVKGT